MKKITLLTFLLALVFVPLSYGQTSNGLQNNGLNSISRSMEYIDQAPTQEFQNRSVNENISRSLLSSDVALFTSTVEPNPWGLTGHRDAMDAVFGSGAWDDVSYETTPAIDVFDANHSFIYMEGGQGSTTELLAYLSANQGTIEDWVSNGGSLFINFASNEVGGTSDLGFGGVTSTGSSYPNTGSASVPGHPIFSGPNVPATGPYAGNNFAHNYITNGGTTLITGEFGNPIVTELSFGSGIAMFGGLTAPFIGNNGSWTPIPNQELMFQNLIVYLFDAGGTPPPTGPTLDYTFCSEEMPLEFNPPIVASAGVVVADSGFPSDTGIVGTGLGEYRSGERSNQCRRRNG